MSTQYIKEKIKRLQDLLNRHNYLYYVLDQPKISDLEFDSLMTDLINLEKDYPEFSHKLSPTQRVGGQLLYGFKIVRHNYPMLSLANTYSQGELEDFNQRIKKYINLDSVDYTCELKYDGVAITLIYEKGFFKQAITRGDGVFGDDVTENVKTIKSIPLTLFGDFPEFLEIRGEVFVEKKRFQTINDDRNKKKTFLKKEYHTSVKDLDPSSLDFQRINKKFIAETKRLEQYSNARNFASGSLKLLDSSRVASRNLSCILYAIHADDLPYDNHFQNLLEAKKWGFKVPNNIELHSSIDGIMNFIQKNESKRHNLPFEIDGIVIKVNELAKQNLLGHTSKSPRWAISYKFQSPKANTILNNITYQVGRTGTITPVAELAPVSLAGSVIKRASLHNEAFIKKLDLKIGDSVNIEKGGDVIPKVVSVNLNRRNLLCQTIHFISKCPSCDADLQRLPDEANYYCFNSSNCIPQKIGQIEHFISRDAMNIHALGSKTIELLFKESLIHNVGDLYDLKIDHLIGLQGFGERSKSSKKAQNIIHSIKDSRQITFDKVLYGLGIRHVGKTVSKKLTKHFMSISNLMNASLIDLLAVEEVGDKIANSVFSYLRENSNIVLINRLKNAGLMFYIANNEMLSTKLDGLSFVVSGTFSISREELKKLIEINGGKITSSLSKKTHYLIVGDNFGNKKKEIADSLSIKMISELEFKKMLK